MLVGSKRERDTTVSHAAVTHLLAGLTALTFLHELWWTYFIFSLFLENYYNGKLNFGPTETTSCSYS